MAAERQRTAAAVRGHFTCSRVIRGEPKDGRDNKNLLRHKLKQHTSWQTVTTHLALSVRVVNNRTILKNLGLFGDFA